MSCGSQHADLVQGPFRVRHFGPCAIGQSTELHEHAFDHLLVVTRGEFAVCCILPSGERVDLKILGQQGRASTALIKAKVRHGLDPLVENSTYMCLFFHRDPDTGEIVKEYAGNELAYI